MAKKADKLKYWIAKILFIIGFRKYVGTNLCNKPAFITLWDWQERWLDI